MNQRTQLLTRIILWSFGLHIILIVLTILEVFFYSSLINSGKEVSVYEQHAQLSGPYIGIIIGFILVFWIGRRMAKRFPSHVRLIGLGLPAGYIVLDFIIVVLTVADWMNNGWIFGVSYATKILAGYLVIRMAKN